MHIKVEYPEAVINIREIKACIDAGDTIGEILERHLEEIDQDITIKTSAESGIQHREKILGIQPLDTASLEDRRLEVLLRWWSSPVYTETTLRQKLDAVLGRENYILDIELDKKQVSCQVEVTRKYMIKGVEDLFEQMAPAATEKPSATPAPAASQAPKATAAPPAQTVTKAGIWDAKPLAAFSGNELVYSATLGDWRTHNGADYAAPAGESVTAAKAGKVVSVSEDALWGGVVEVEDANGVTWRYCGVAAPAVKAGDSVTAAAALGTAGSIPAETSGDAHIHLECVKDGAYLDPEGLM